jgi:hypothetical protein
MYLCYEIFTHKASEMRWAGYVAWMGREEACTGFCWGNLRERDHWGEPGVDGSIILRWIYKKWDVGVWAGLSWLRIDRWRALANEVMNLRVP